ncbi:hypothetical protein Ahy_Scaffold6g107868 [Arachis hypogaea]|uniref:Transposase MuDR plant domain-containing protein n=1 Tax=Arachis hypogaea TaxID=3818 RepID=A0A444WPN2_ARAHY|nr:hypothetical protein Ahy_Scaffold6g107868 [Arachis hypogaea]
MHFNSEKTSGISSKPSVRKREKGTCKEQLAEVEPRDFVLDGLEVAPFGMATVHITLCINHRGRFERRPCGKLELGKELEDGLRDLRVDMDIARMYEATVKNSNRINVYTKHPVDEPVLVEENNMTPSKLRVKRCAKRVPTPKKSPKKRLIVVKDEDDAKIVCNMKVGLEEQKRSVDKSREEAYGAHKEARVEAQKEDNTSMAQETADPPFSGSDEAGQASQPPPTPVIPDKPPSTQSQPSQPPIKEEQQPTQTAYSNSVLSSDPNISAPLEPEQLTQYTPHPYGNPLSQSISQTVPPVETNRTPQNDQSNPSNEVEGRPKELHSIASDEDTEQTPVFPHSNTDAPVNQVRLEVGMEFETLSHFWKAVRKFNINIGRSIFFARCDSTRSNAICYDEDCSWQIYCVKRIFPASFQPGHNKRSCKKRKEAAGEGSSAPQAPADDDDEDMLAEMYYEETLESAEAEQEATEEGNETARTNTQQQPHPMPPPPTA